jgi:hypothetical protein
MTTRRPSSAADLLPLLPELVLIGGAFALLILDLFLDNAAPRHHPRAGAAVAGPWCWRCWPPASGGQGTVFNGMFVRDTLADVSKVVILLVSAPVAGLWLAVPARAQAVSQGRVPVLVLFATAGMMMMVSAGSLVMVYLGLELLALCSYAPGGAEPRRRPGHRGGDEVHRAGFAGVGPAAVRHVAGLRRHRHADLAGIHAAAAQVGERDPAADRRGVPGRRRGLQARRGAVPHVAAGRLPGCTDAGDPVHQLGAQAGRLRHGLPPAGGAGVGPMSRRSGSGCWLAWPRFRWSSAT